MSTPLGNRLVFLDMPCLLRSLSVLFLPMVVLAQVVPCLPTPSTAVQLPNAVLSTNVNGLYVSNDTVATPTGVTAWGLSSSIVSPVMPGEYMDVVISLSFDASINAYVLSYSCSYNLSGTGSVNFSYAQFLNWAGCSQHGMLYYSGGTSDPNKIVWTLSGGHISNLHAAELTNGTGIEKNTTNLWAIPNSTRAVGTAQPLSYTGTGVHIAIIKIQFFPGLNRALHVNLSQYNKMSWWRGGNPALAITDSRVVAPGTISRLLVFGYASPTNIAVGGITGVIGLDISNTLATFSMVEDPSGASASTIFNTPTSLFASYYVSGLRAQVFYATPTGIEAGDAIDF